jgi:hypothetical protein
MSQHPSPALLVCPTCGTQADLAVFMMQPDFADSVRLCLDLLGQQGDVLVGYLGLFKPAKQRMTPARLKAALAELVPLMDAGQFKRNGNTYTCPRVMWVNGMQAVLANRATIKPPLTNHAYLLTVMAGMMDSANDKATKLADDKRDNERRARVLNPSYQPVQPNDDGVGELPDHGTLPSPEVRAQIMQSLANIGKNMTFGAKP